MGRMIRKSGYRTREKTLSMARAYRRAKSRMCVDKLESGRVADSGGDGGGLTRLR